MSEHMKSLSKMTNFESVGEFHRVFGHPHHKIIQPLDEKTADFRLSLITEEYNELKEAIQANDMPQVIDALGDLLYVIYGMGHTFGINLDKAFEIVHKSNMSKLCCTEDEAKETIEHYKTLPGFENVDVRYRASDCGNYFVIYNSQTGKILKSKFFKAPDFKELC